ncbi:MAG: hypothetical protein L3J79_02650 [Candidatus Marinimicrobia bacterium]|nr:hypothetical protein [Candidatus Neomarinimicrobiota bacterium]
MGKLRDGLIAALVSMMILATTPIPARAVAVDLTKTIRLPADTTIIVIDEETGEEKWRGECRRDEAEKADEDDERKYCGALIINDLSRGGNYTVMTTDGTTLGTVNVPLFGFGNPALLLAVGGLGILAVNNTGSGDGAPAAPGGGGTNDFAGNASPPNYTCGGDCIPGTQTLEVSGSNITLDPFDTTNGSQVFVNDSLNHATSLNTDIIIYGFNQHTCYVTRTSDSLISVLCVYAVNGYVSCTSSCSR